MTLIIELTDDNNNIVNKLRMFYDNGGAKANVNYQFEYLEKKGERLTELDFLHCSLEDPFGEMTLFYLGDNDIPITSVQSLEDAGIDNDYPDDDYEFPFLFKVSYTHIIDKNSPIEKIIIELEVLLSELYECEEALWDEVDSLLDTKEFEGFVDINNDECDSFWWLQIISFIKFCVEKIQKNPELSLSYSKNIVMCEHSTGSIYEFVESKFNC